VSEIVAADFKIMYNELYVTERLIISAAKKCDITIPDDTEIQLRSAGNRNQSRISGTSNLMI
jgi:hypothetical protein